MRTLVIGGSGTISTAVTRRLLERGDHVTLFNRGHSAPPENARLIRGDRADRARFESLLRDQEPFDCAIDMIGYSGDDARSLARALAGRAAQVIFCSTVDVYSKRGALYPQREGARRATPTGRARSSARKYLGPRPVAATSP